MLLKKIELHNFRQFLDSKIEFACDENTNVTMVIADNGAGKTTLAQAFLWVLYGDTDFKIKQVINRKVRDKLTCGMKTMVEVSLFVNHNDKDYIIRRSQEIKRLERKFEEQNSELSISYKNKGNLEYLSNSSRDSMIKQMLPEELSRFFFFDGERIKIMSDEIDSGKSAEFKSAVQGLVGLTAMQNAIRHLKPSTGSSTVVGRYQLKIDESGNEKVKKFVSMIAQLEDKLQSLDKRINEITPLLKEYRDEEANLKATILITAPKVKIKEKYEETVSKIERLKSKRNDQISKVALTAIDNHLFGYLSYPLISKVLPELSTDKSWDAGIPKLQAETILFLMKRGTCLCGADIEPGTSEFNTLNSLLDYVPPKSVGTLVGEVKTRFKVEKKSATTFWNLFSEAIKTVRETEDEIDNLHREEADLFEQISNTDEGEIARVKLMRTQADIKRIDEELLNKASERKEKQKDKERQEAERDKFQNIDATNKKNIIYREYAKYLYEGFMKRYHILENETRYNLEKKINEIFPEIYEGGLSIELDERYNIKVIATEDDLSEEELEKNTAQSYSIIFAFITAVISMAKEKAVTATDEAEKKLFSEAEAYPLVMDAPLSNFDKTRIEQICTTIPRIARQVIIFIKDTDGEVAEKYMSNRIGKQYVIKKVNKSKVTSIIEERK